MVKNMRGISLGHGTLEYAASQDVIDVKSWFFACWEVGTICQLAQLLLLLLVVILLLLVSYNIIFFGLFMPMSHGVNKKTPPSASHHLPPH